MAEVGGRARRQPPRNGDSDWLTLGQAARYLGVAQSTIRKWSDQGRLPAFYTPGGHRRYRQGDLDAFVAGSASGPSGRRSRRDRPRLVVLDRMMPHVDGWQMLQAVRERHGVDSIQVIMFSGKVDADATSQAEAGGAQAFLGKPFNPQELVSRTKDLLGN